MAKTKINPRLKEALGETETNMPSYLLDVPETVGYKRRADLTPQLISLAHHAHLFVELESEIIMQSMPGIARNENGKVPVVWVRDLKTGDHGVLVCTAVLCGVFERLAPIKGKHVEILSSDPREGKQYRDVRVWELAD